MISIELICCGFVDLLQIPSLTLKKTYIKSIIIMHMLIPYWNLLKSVNFIIIM